jgi:hypothetical protein
MQDTAPENPWQQPFRKMSIFRPLPYSTWEWCYCHSWTNRIHPEFISGFILNLFQKLFPAIRCNLYFRRKSGNKGFSLLSGLGHSIPQTIVIARNVAITSHHKLIRSSKNAIRKSSVFLWNEFTYQKIKLKTKN